MHNVFTCPIFNQQGFIGNGFLFDNLFITAGHIIEQNISDGYYYIINDKTYQLHNALFYEYHNEEHIDSIRMDLAIFQQNQVHSPLKSYGVVTPKPNTPIRIQGFHLLQNREIEPFISHGEIHRNHGYQSVSAYKTIRQNNIFEIRNANLIEAGISGSPVFYNNNVCGMIIAQYCDLLIALSSSYILAKLIVLTSKQEK